METFDRKKSDSIVLQNRVRVTVALLVVGASARAAAFSAARAGLPVICADLHADLDLSARFPVTRVRRGEYPEALERAAAAAPDGPWMYTGALENYPALVGRIAARRQLWGNAPEVLGRVRDPFRVAACLARAGIAHPRVRAMDDAPTRGDWLVKPIAGAGGRDIVHLSRMPAAHTPARAVARHEALGTRFFQERIAGTPLAALYVADGHRAMLAGVTRQLVGEPLLGARPFHYCGSIGPIELAESTRAACMRLGDALADAFGLVGLFGIDGILREGVFWPVEINPRYTASVELLEHALRLPLVALHADACAHNRLPPEPVGGTARHEKAPVLGKAILFAPADITAPDLRTLLDSVENDLWVLPRLADVPAAGTMIPAGKPVLTVFAAAASVDACRDALIASAQAIYQCFGL